MTGTSLSDLVAAKRRHLAEARRTRGPEHEIHVRTALRLRRIIRSWSREWNE